MKKEKIILIFTTTYKALYKRDFLLLCCKSVDEVIRYGYDKRHLAKEIAENPKTIENRTALVIFAEYIQKDDVYRYHPIRYGHIKKVDDEVDSVSLEIELRSYFRYQASDTINTLNNVYTVLDSLTDKPLTKTQQAGNTFKSCFVLETEKIFPKNASPKESSDWRNLVSYISKLEDLRNITFFRQASELFTQEQKVKTNLDLRQKSSSTNPLQVRSGEMYSIHLKVFNGPDADVNVYPVLKLNQNISFGGPYIRQDGALLTECTYRLVPVGTFSTIHSPLAITIEIPNEKGKDAIRSPQIDNFVIVKPPRFFTTVVVVLFLIGLALPDLAEHVIPKLITTNPVVVLTLQLLAPLFLLLASFLGFKKLPLK